MNDGIGALWTAIRNCFAPADQHAKKHSADLFSSVLCFFFFSLLYFYLPCFFICVQQISCIWLLRHFISVLIVFLTCVRIGPRHIRIRLRKVLTASVNDIYRAV